MCTTQGRLKTAQNKNYNNTIKYLNNYTGFEMARFLRDTS